MTAKATYGPRSIKKKKKRNRRTKAEMAVLRTGVYSIVKQIQPTNVRAVFYQATVQKLVPKEESQYKAIGRLLTQMRKVGELPYAWIVDNTRWMRKPQTHSSLQGWLAESQDYYRRALRNDQDAYVEIWIEKVALVGVFYDVTAKWDVPLMAGGGFSSHSFLFSAGEHIADLGKPTFIYLFGDRDPSGLRIDRHIERELRRHAPDVDITFERVAVLPEQIDQLNLPTRPTKQSKHSKGFNGESVELDAINPNTLREMAESCITRHIDSDRLERTLAVESAERETLEQIAETFGGAA